MSSMLHQLPPNCIAECVLSPRRTPVGRRTLAPPRDCPVNCGDIVLRLSNGTFSPAVDMKASTLTSYKWQGAALFDVLAADLTPDDWALWHANEARRVAPGDGWVYGPQSLAKIIGNAARLTRSAADACALLNKTRANLGLSVAGSQ